jgi:hypothetical protein
VVERMKVQKAVRVLDSQGLPRAPVDDITLKDCTFEGVTEKSIIQYTNKVNLEGVRVNGKVVRDL